MTPIGIKRRPCGEGPRPQKARPRWQMGAAYYYDLWARDEGWIADDLDLALDGDLNRGPRSKSARRYIAAGRKQLSELGAWPWCLATDGRVSGDGQWWIAPRYVNALSSWHFASFRESLMSTLNPIRHAAGDRPNSLYWRPADERLAVQLYNQQFDEFGSGAGQRDAA